MAVVVDSGILYADYDRSDRWHRAAAALVERDLGGLLVPAPVIPEVDHLLGARLGREARRLLYRGFVEASYLMVELRRLGCGKLTLEVREDNHGALALYRSLGFGDPLLRREPQRTLVLEKALAANTPVDREAS